MKETYKEIAPGWLWQSNITSEPMHYDENYVLPYTKYDDRLSYLRLHFCERYAKFYSVLDVGYGDGNFLKVANRLGFKCFGNDISGYPLPDGVTFIDDRRMKVDLVTFFDCIEHFPQENVEEVLKELNCNHVCISVPWCHFDNFETWKHRKPNEHFHHFDVRGITELLNRGGFDLIVSASIEDVVRTNKGSRPNILTVIGKRK
jgi:SAM-dependent methyltransferase